MNFWNLLLAAVAMIAFATLWLPIFACLIYRELKKRNALLREKRDEEKTKAMTKELIAQLEENAKATPAYSMKPL